MIDHNREKIVSFADAAKGLSNRPSVRTIWRWSDKGVRGVRLESLLMGGRRVTSREALDRFFAAINKPVDQPAPLSARRQREIDSAEQELSEAGI